MKTHRLAFFHNQSFRNTLLRANKMVLSLAAGITFLLVAGCSKNNQTAISVDHKDPESVLRAYFKAWEQGDWSFQTSLMDEKYAQMVPEPLDSLRILELQPVPGSSSSERTYQVVFEIKVKGKGVSMQSGKYDWTYYLSWIEKRNSWLITNYGAG
jgi:hypothetical protein